MIRNYKASVFFMKSLKLIFRKSQYWDSEFSLSSEHASFNQLLEKVR